MIKIINSLGTNGMQQPRGYLERIKSTSYAIFQPDN